VQYLNTDILPSIILDTEWLLRAASTVMQVPRTATAAVRRKLSPSHCARSARTLWSGDTCGGQQRLQHERVCDMYRCSLQLQGRVLVCRWVVMGYCDCLPSSDAQPQLNSEQACRMPAPPSSTLPPALTAGWALGSPLEWIFGLQAKQQMRCVCSSSARCAA
jgi:hypothetical protein